VIVLYVRRNTGARLLNRAHVAMKAQNFERAADIAAEYVAQEPGDWKGHQTLGQARLRLGQYAKAREAFEVAMTLAPTEEHSPVLALADTYSLPARRRLAGGQGGTGSGGTQTLKGEQFDQAIEQLRKANAYLAELGLKTDKPGLDARQHIGLNHQAMALGWRRRSVQFGQEEKIARNTHDTMTAGEKYLDKIDAQNKANEEAVEAIKNLLAVVRGDGSRTIAAQGLVQICTGWSDREATEEYMGRVTKAVTDSSSTLPLAAMRLAMHRLRTRMADEPQQQRDKQWQDLAKELDALLEDNPDDVEIRLARGEAALALADFTTARRICDAVLGEKDRHPEARLLRSRIVLAEEVRKPHAEQRDFRPVMSVLVELTNSRPNWVDALYYYAVAADAGRLSADEMLDALEALDTLEKLKEELEETGDILTKAEHAALEKEIAALAERCEKEALFERRDELEAQREGLVGRRNTLKNAASRTMRQIVKDLDPSHFGARRFLVLALEWEGFGQQALDDASEYYKQNPANSEGIRLYFDTALRNGRPELARSILANVPIRIDEARAQIDKAPPAFKKALAEVEKAQAALKALADDAAPEVRDQAEETLEDAQAKKDNAWESLTEGEQADLTDGQAKLTLYNNPRLLRVVARGYVLLRRRNLAAAAEELAKAKEDDRDPDDLLIARRREQAKTMQDAAADALERAAQCKAITAAGYLAVAKAMLAVDRGSEAEKVLRAGLDEDDDQPELHFMLGQVDRQYGRLLEAIEHFEKAVAQYDGDPRYRVALARALFDSGDLAAAQDALEPVDASNVDAKLLRIELALARGESALAGDELGQFSDDKRVNRARALMHFSEGELTKCIDLCTRELEATPADLRLRMLLAQAYNRIGRKDDCLKELARVLQALPDQMPVYLRYADVLATQMDLPAVEKALAKLPGAKAELVDLTVAWLMERNGELTLALTVYERLLERDDAPVFYKNRARLLKASVLGRLGQVDQALGELDALAANERWDRLAIVGKIELLMRAGRNAEALTAVGRLRKVLAKAANAPGLLRLARVYLQLQAPDEAMAVCEQVKKLKPGDTSPYVLRARLLAIAGDREQAVEALIEASKLQPNNLEIQLELARALDAQNRPRHALDVLDRLERIGPDGKIRALFERGRLLTMWGLPAPAAKAFERLSKLGYETSPAIQLSLGRSLAQLGRTDDARKRLESVTIHAPQYVAARQVLASIAPSTADKLKVLAALDVDKPGRSDVLAQRMSILMGEKKPGEALKAFSTFNTLIRDKKITESSRLDRVSLFALTCLTEIGQATAAWEFASRRAETSRLPHWRRLAVLLGIDQDAGRAGSLLEGIERMDLTDVYLGIVLAVSRRDALAERTWADRADRLAAAMAAAKPPQRVYPRYLLLSSLATGRVDDARKTLETFGAAAGIDREAADELVANFPNDPGARGEAAMLLKAMLAIDFGLRDLGRSWAVKALSSRPRCQWAAILAFRAGADAEAGGKLLDMLHPKDCATALTIKAFVLNSEKKHAESAEIYRRLAEKNPGNIGMMLDHAASVEKAGHLEEALKLYQKIQAVGTNPVAANNGAYLVTQVCPDDVKRVTEAHKWMDETVKAYPRMSAFRETRGYLAFLLGRGDEARADIRQAIKGLTQSPDAHYHLGLVESQIGDVEMARWHFEAAVSSCRAIEDRGATPTVAERTAAKLASEILATFGRGKETSRPGRTAPAPAGAPGSGTR